MRTTVTLDEDTLAVVRRRMRERGVSFETARNDAICDGEFHQPQPAVFPTTTADLGVATVNLDPALQLAADLEDEKLMRR